MLGKSKMTTPPAVTGHVTVVLGGGGAQAHYLRQLLAMDGVSAVVVENTALIARSVQGARPRLVVLDARTSPSGCRTCYQTLRRQFPTLQILVLLPVRNEAQIAAMLDDGVDDCLVAPFTPHDVLIRIQVLLHRAHQQAPARREFARLSIDLDAWQVRIDGTLLHVTALEFAILSALSREPELVIAREHLASMVWGEEAVSDARLLDAHICRLRKKLLAAGLHPCPLQTVRGVGYVFRE